MQFTTVLFALASSALLVAADTSCPQADESRFKVASGKTFQLLCGTDINQGQDLAVNYEQAHDYISCAQTCDDYNRKTGTQRCAASVWDNASSVCYLKEHYDQRVQKATSETCILG